MRITDYVTISNVLNIVCVLIPDYLECERGKYNLNSKKTTKVVHSRRMVLAIFCIRAIIIGIC